MVHTSHGNLPVPVPAVVELLRGAPTYGTGHPAGADHARPARPCWPPCAAGWGPMPAMEITASGFGAGSRELDGLPNAVQVVIGTAADRSGIDPDHGQPVVVLEANVDDVTGEILGATVAALDARRGPWMPGSRRSPARRAGPAHVVSVLGDDRLGQPAPPGAGRRDRNARHPGPVVAALAGGAAVRRGRGRRATRCGSSGGRAASRRSTTTPSGSPACSGLPVREVARRAEEAAHRLFDGRARRTARRTARRRAAAAMEDPAPAAPPAERRHVGSRLTPPPVP